MLALDDLQWADGATLLTVGWAMRRLTAVPLMLAAAVRAPKLIQLLDDAARLPATFRPPTAAAPDSPLRFMNRSRLNSAGVAVKTNGPTKQFEERRDVRA